MNGLQLSREYFVSVAEPKLKLDFPALHPHLAAGLAGNGSECFGYDDEISRDHDWGADFYIWVEDEDSGSIPALQSWKDELMKSSPPSSARERSEYGARVAVMTCSSFYSGLIGASGRPETLNEWLRAPEENFAMAVNGEVFADGPGTFTRTRNALLSYYPEDIRLKRIAAKLMALAQTGQYNLLRTSLRDDRVTLRTIVSRFTDAAIALVFLLNKVYRPYYKWAYRALGGLPLLGAETARTLREIADVGGFDQGAISELTCLAERLCATFAAELGKQYLSGSDDSFLAAHAEEVRKRIKSGSLRDLPVQYDI